MASSSRVNFGRGSREPGTQAGIQVSTFGFDALLQGVNGQALAEITADALKPSLEYALAEWPVLTGASRDSIRVEITEVGPRFGRAALLVGGEQLKSDPRNITPGKDYAPFIEYNGTPTTPPGTLSRAIFSHQRDIRDRTREGIRTLIAEILSRANQP